MRYEHKYKAAENGKKTFVLLHGTGGDMDTLTPIARSLGTDYGYLAVRGDVIEESSGMRRFFKREGEGNYDWDDLNERSEALFAFLQEASDEYALPLEDMILLGFSNGSNIALQVLFEHGEVFSEAVIMASLYPKDRKINADLNSLDVFLSAGVNDPMVPVEASEHVISLLENAGADVTVHWTEAHRLTTKTLEDLKRFLETTLGENNNE